MIRGFYTGASSMIARTKQMDVIANNLANVNTTGYKKDLTTFKAFPEMVARRINDEVRIFPLGSTDLRPVVGRLGTGVELNEVYNQKDQSGLRITENNLDFSIDGEGFFVIKTDRGERYTRNGSFTLNAQNELVTQEGHPVMGNKGTILIRDKEIMVDAMGRIFDQPELSTLPNQKLPVLNEGEIIDQLKIVRFERPRYLEKQGSSFFTSSEESGPALPAKEILQRNGTSLEPAKIIQKSLETSNVNPVQEMVKMIEVQRAYEAAQKTITSGDQLLNRLINNMASV